jgi:hypothetical protein
MATRIQQFMATASLAAFFTVSVVPAQAREMRYDTITELAAVRTQAAQRVYKKRGPEAFIQTATQGLKMDQESQATLKGVFAKLPKMPGVSFAGNVITIGSQPAVTIEVLADRKDANKVEFKINGKFFSWSDALSFKKNAEAIGTLIEGDFKKDGKKSAWKQASDLIVSLLVPSAHADGYDYDDSDSKEKKGWSGTTVALVSVIVAMVVGLVAYNWGKSNGKKEGKIEADKENVINDLRREIDELKGIESSGDDDVEH